MRAVCLLVLAVVTAAPAARADAPVAPHELRSDVAVDTAITSTSIGLVLGSELGKRDLAPAACRWCGTNALDDGARATLRWSSPKTASLLSNVSGFVVAPGAAFGTLAIAGAHDGAAHDTPTDMLLVLESVSLTAVATQLVKYTVARERPYARYRSASSGEPVDPDDRLSFFSGHTSLTFALAAASGSVATLRGYRLAPLTWISTGAVAIVTGWLRMAADKHWLTDVLVGAVVGTAIGIAVPVAFHPRKDDPAASSAAALTTTPPATPTLAIGASF